MGRQVRNHVWLIVYDDVGVLAARSILREVLAAESLALAKVAVSCVRVCAGNAVPTAPLALPRREELLDVALSMIAESAPVLDLRSALAELAAERRICCRGLRT